MSNTSYKLNASCPYTTSTHTLSYSAKDYYRPSSYAYCFYQVSQRGTSMPPVQTTYGDCLMSIIGHPYWEDKENRYMDSSYNALSNSTTVILIRDLRISVHADTMCHFCVHGFSWQPNVLL